MRAPQYPKGLGTTLTNTISLKEGREIQYFALLHCVHCVCSTCSGELAVVGLDDLSVDSCEYPCQMRKIVGAEDPGFNIDTLENDLAVLTLEAPVMFTDEVSVDRVLTLYKNGSCEITQRLFEAFGELCD